MIAAAMSSPGLRAPQGRDRQGCRDQSGIGRGEGGVFETLSGSHPVQVSEGSPQTGGIATDEDVAVHDGLHGLQMLAR